MWRGPDIFASLSLLPHELTSALNRKRREHALPHGAYHRLRQQIAEDLGKIHFVPLDAELLGFSLRMLDAHPLKALDSFYLAAALGLKLALKEQVRFVAADRQLLHAAHAEGLDAFDPERTP